METFNEEKLVKYQMDEKEIVVGFATFQDAENYAAQSLGDLVEVGFKDGNDNPQLTNEASLISQKLHYFVEAGPEYKFIHSADPAFRDYADQLQERKADLNDDSPEEKYIANAEIEISEDPIIVLKNNEFESITSRERSKYLKQANVYEIGVSKPLEL
ncbi:hypothetical protein [Kaistella antarctica]|uniref:Uncharacterized protein n=1 Tax=Kaistella antarctica TaxID=266748 RepID=A0A3S4UWP4_9FLAO|nr:hypothetical protein [Kaistella antarctica]KEY19429.1 hypothetical protein HY04_13610 [Kaistella antarctica]SEW06913.1 hypothetical protein SAMN05421765_2165 [Kaistella antarctica]VEH97493.1 Uncharacterised protein [Kaistella antarctica]